MWGCGVLHTAIVEVEDTGRCVLALGVARLSNKVTTTLVLFIVIEGPSGVGAKQASYRIAS